MLTVPGIVSTRATCLSFLFVVALAGCFRSSSTGDTRSCDCCGTAVEVPLGESCSEGACDPYCRGTDLGLWLPDMGPDLGGRTELCHCCGTDVEVPAGTECALGICDPYCLGLDCNARPVDALCDYGFVSANRPTNLPVLFGSADGESCFCAESIRCEAAIVAEGTIALRTEICDDPAIDCDGCAPFVRGQCGLPALSEGAWRVTVNGEDAFELAVAPEGVAPEWGLSCSTRAGAGGSCGGLWPPRTETPSLVCHPQAAPANRRVAIRVTHACPACNVPAGPCEVDVFDDLIRVRTSTIDSSCDIACPPVCVERVDTCLTPELPEGTWRVIVDGLEGYESELEVGPGLVGAAEVCGPLAPGG